jgi:hypothetical protein
MTAAISNIFVLMLENRSFDHMLGFSGISGTDAVSGKTRLVGNLRSKILMVQSAQNRHRQRATDGLHGTWDRRVLVQRWVRTSLIVIFLVRIEQMAECRSPKTTTWSRHSRRIEPMSLSEYPFCHGDRGEIGRSRMPIARSRLRTISP